MKTWKKERQREREREKIKRCTSFVCLHCSCNSMAFDAFAQLLREGRDDFVRFCFVNVILVSMRIIIISTHQNVIF